MNFPPSTAEYFRRIDLSGLPATLTFGNSYSSPIVDARAFDTIRVQIAGHVSSANLHQRMFIQVTCYENADGSNKIAEDWYGWYPSNLTNGMGAGVIFIQDIIKGPFVSVVVLCNASVTFSFDAMTVSLSSRSIYNRYVESGVSGSRSQLGILLTQDAVVLAAGVSQDFLIDPGYGPATWHLFNSGANPANFILFTYNFNAGAYRRFAAFSLAAGQLTQVQISVPTSANYLQVDSTLGTTITTTIVRTLQPF